MMKFASLIGALLVLGFIYAATISPLPQVFNNVGLGCTQPNATGLICTNGSPIQISFVASSTYSPSYGSFTLVSLNPNITQPVDAYGAPCAVGSGQTNICLVTIAPYSPLLGNATVSQKVALKFTSGAYPQVYSYLNFSISLHHYLNSSDAALLQSYRSTLSTFSTQASYYNYVCAGYGICNATVAESISASNVLLLNVHNALQLSNLAQAYTNMTVAQTAAIQENTTFLPFYSNAKAILSYLTAAFSDINAAQTNYRSNFALLQNCTYSSGSDAAAYLNNRIQLALSSAVPSTLAQAQSYEGYASGMLQNSTSIIASCRQYHSYSPPFLGIGFALPNPFGGGLLWDAVLVVIILIAALLIRSRIISRNELKRIRNPVEEDLDSTYSKKELGKAEEVVDAEIDDDGEYLNKVSKKK